MTLWLPGYYYRVPIAIANTHRSGETLTNFPVNVMFSANTTLGALARWYNVADGRWTDSDGVTPLNFEGLNYSISTRELSAEWYVAKTLVGATNPETAYYYFGKTSETYGGSASAWDANAKLVLHFGSTSSLSLADSTGLNTPTNVGPATAGIGKILGGVTLDGSTQCVTIPAGATTSPGSGNWTWSCWAKLTSHGVYQELMRKYGTSATPTWSLYDYTDNKVHFQFRDDGNHATEPTVTTPTDGLWHHYCGVRNVTTITPYLDGVAGVPVTNASLGTLTTSGGQPLQIGRYLAYDGTNPTSYVSGILDDVRIANTARSATWIGFQYANANGGDVTIGSIEGLGYPVFGRGIRTGGAL